MLEGDKFINLFINFSFLQKSVSKTVILLVFVSKMILLSNGLVEEIYLICNNNDLLLLRAIEDNLEKCSHIKKEKNKPLFVSTEIYSSLGTIEQTRWEFRKFRCE